MVDDRANDEPSDAGVASSRRSSRRRRCRRASRLDLVARRIDDWPLETTTAGLTATTLAAAVLAIGAVHPPVMLGVGALATASLISALLLRFGERASLPLTWPAILCWLLAAWTVLQLVPLPMALLEIVAPANADNWSRALLPLAAEPPGWAPVTLDPGATWIEALRWYSYGACFTAASVVASHRSARWGLTLVFVVATAAALVTLGHGLLGMRRVYGIYSPSFGAQPWHVGPLLNPNNLAGLLNLGALCGLGLVATRSPPISRWLLVAGTILLVGVDVTSASRGGVIALFVGILAFAAAVELVRRRRGGEIAIPASRMRMALFATVAVGSALAVLGMNRLASRELLSENMEKLELLAMIEPVVADYTWLGTGRGSFESVFPAYQSTRGNVVYTHAENFVAQWIVEWGVPVGVVAVLAFGFLFGPRRLGVGKRVAAAGAWIGVMVLVAQNLVDLGLEVPALCLAVAVTTGTLWGDARGAGRTLSRRSAPPGQALRGAIVGGAIGAILVTGAAWRGLNDLSSDRTQLRAAVVGIDENTDAATRARIVAELRAAILRHPADPYFPLLGALLAASSPEGTPMPWLQRSLERSLANGRAHLLLAQVLRQHGALRQALLELRLAQEADPNLIAPAARLGGAWANTVEQLAIMIPSNHDAAWTWDALGATSRDRTLGAECDRRALGIDANRPGPKIRLAQDLIVSLQDAEGRCHDDRDACKTELDELIAGVREAMPDASMPVVLEARWLAASGGAEKAEAMLASACEAARDYQTCLQARADVARLIDDPERFAKAAKALRSAACADAEACADVTTWIADAHVGRREYGAAIAGYERALRDAETDERLDKLAKAASLAGLHTKAIRALERLASRRGTVDPALQARIDRERQAVVKTMLEH